MKTPRDIAQERLEGLERQQEGIVTAIAELRAFIKWWDVLHVDAEQGKAGGGKEPRRQKAPKQLPATMADLMVAALGEDVNSGLTAAQVAKRIVEMGYVHKKETKLETVVAQELGRQAKLGRRGIVKSGSRYKLAS